MPRSAASDRGLLCFSMSLFWDVRYIWFNTVIFYCISGNHRHVFSRGINQPASFKLLLLIFLQCEKEQGLRIPSRGYKAYPVVHSGDAFSCMIPRSAYNGLQEMCTEIE